MSAAGARYSIVPAESQASYIAREKFVDRPLPNEAIGTTRDISGAIVVEDPASLAAHVLDMKIDLRTLKSDQNRRDQFIRGNFLESDKFPFAEFRSDRVVGAPEGYREGDEVTFELPGVMTVHETERPVTWDVTARLQGDTISGTATTGFNMSDFNVPPPQRPVLSVEDFVKLEVKLVARRS